jgi:predicted nucleic acid-binding protein
VILVDANLLIYAFDSVSPYHPIARSRLDEQLSGTSAVGIPGETLAAFCGDRDQPKDSRRWRSATD